MCGIVGYIGHRDAYPILIGGLKRLEYRGYDSAGVALLQDDFILFKKAGKVKVLEDFIGDSDVSGHVGIGHTRWATHGLPNDMNAHPHLSNSGQLMVIHNGIIENYDTIKSELNKRNYNFKYW
jgi:glucosamine--fructose-6-phosphate aminotransferase (isomerizing)